MALIIKFPKKMKIDTTQPLYEGPEIVGVPKEPPKNGAEYLKICKNVLENDEYTEVCTGILDLEYYLALDPDLQTIVDHYHAFEGNV